MMYASSPRFEVLVEPGRCWGSRIGDDCTQGACAGCVDVCPEVFEKPEEDACARVRPGADLARYVARIHEAIDRCPSDAIHLVQRGA
jgi:ferredoxin